MAETKGKFLRTVILCILFPLAIKANTINENHEVVLNQEYDTVLKWRVAGDDIFFEMSAKTYGYVAIGFSPNGGMPGSDIVAGWVKDDVAFLSDYHATGFAKPDIDLSNDYTLIYGFEEGNKTTIGFSRKLQTCDPNDYTITSDTSRIIWAVNDNDPPNRSDLSYHGTARGVRSVILLDAVTKLNELPNDAENFDLLTSNASVPTDDTTYWCTSFAVPKFEKPVHLFRFDAIIQKGHEALVHHMVLVGCRGNVSSITGWSNICERKKFMQCTEILYAWAIGAGSFEFPEHVGLLLGGGNDPDLLFIETHYDNPGRRPDFVDNSGLRIHFTPTLRQYNAEVWLLGESFLGMGQMIPPNEPDFKTHGICFGDCTKLGIEEDIKVFAALLHGHLAVRKISMQHYRDGKLIDEIRDDNYDFNLQETRLLTEERILKPGDDLMVTCSYNTMDRTNITFGGEGTTEEMCLSFLYYYPRQPKLYSCLSSPSEASFINMLGLDKDNTSVPADLIYQITQLNSKDLKEGLREVMDKGKRYNLCFDRTGGLHEGTEFEIDFPEWYKEDKQIKTKDLCPLTLINGGSRTIMAGYLSMIAVFSMFTMLITM